MTADWEPLAPSDPVPGDPLTVLRLAGRYAAAAEDVGTQAGALRRTGRSRWSGAAADEFEHTVGVLPDDLARVARRFQRVAQALRDFAPALQSAQRRARVALALAREAQAVQQARAALAGPPALVVRPDLPMDRITDRQRDPRDQAAADDLAHAHRLLATACEERDRAAARCARALAGASHDRLRNPSGWHRLLSSVSRLAGGLSAQLGVAAVVLCWVPGLGEILGAAALGLGTVSLLADLTLTAYGETSGRHLLLDAVGVLPLGRAARLGALMSREAAVARAVRGVGANRLGSVLWGRALRAMARPARFEGARGLHGLAAAGPVGVARDTAVASRDLAAAVQVGAGLRSLPDFLRSPGGLLDDIARARAQGAGGVAWLMGSHVADVVQAGVGLQPADRAGAR